MIDLCKLLSLTISLIVVLNCDPISGQNEKFLTTSVSKAKGKQSLQSMAKQWVPSADGQSNPSAEYEPQVAETRAQHSVVSSDEEDLAPAAGHGYYQYARVPHKGAWEFGYKRGNPHHYREQHEQGHGHKFKTKLKWGDKKGGHGEHYWDYNHAGKHKGWKKHGK